MIDKGKSNMEGIYAIARFISYRVFPRRFWIWMEGRMAGMHHTLLRHASGRVW
jgi:hypothetical protein